MNDQDFYNQIGTATRPILAQSATGGPHPYQPPPVSGIPYAGGKVTVRRWARSDDNFWPASETCETLEPAFYRFGEMPNVGPCLIRTNISTDGLIVLPDTAASEVMSEFDEFWERREEFTKRGFLHKRGILLWGPPGSGKTCSLTQMAQTIIAHHGGIVCQIDHPKLASLCLGFIRKIEPDRPIVALIEDLDALVERFGENEFLAMLDGETQVDRILYVATTNYPERLDRRFVDRPSRFDTVRFIGMPSAAARRVYLQNKEPSLCGDELDLWVHQSDGFSIAHLREMVILVRCFGRPLGDAVRRLEAMRVRKPSSDDAPDRQPFGIMGGKSR
jgi:hypothetical protein